MFQPKWQDRSSLPLPENALFMLRLDAQQPSPHSIFRQLKREGKWEIGRGQLVVCKIALPNLAVDVTVWHFLGSSKVIGDHWSCLWNSSRWQSAANLRVDRVSQRGDRKMARIFRVSCEFEVFNVISLASSCWHPERWTISCVVCCSTRHWPWGRHDHPATPLCEHPPRGTDQPLARDEGGMGQTGCNQSTGGQIAYAQSQGEVWLSHASLMKYLSIYV